MRSDRAPPDASEPPVYACALDHRYVHGTRVILGPKVDDAKLVVVLTIGSK